ncbi:MAG: hypothetical protein HUJ96_09455 [Marinilabiliaceae bacterium]|nr:hypothetical protein [Marinilabiliaceae bacterium]
MSQSSEEIANQVFDKISKVVDKIERLKSRETYLEMEVSRLDSLIKEKERELQELEEKFRIYRTAVGLGAVSEGEREDAKKRLAKIVRDIDKCIALLNQ